MAFEFDFKLMLAGKLEDVRSCTGSPLILKSDLGLKGHYEWDFCLGSNNLDSIIQTSQFYIQLLYWPHFGT